MKAIEDSQVMNGTYGELWVNGQYMAEVTSFSAKVSATYEDIKRVRNLMPGKKITGLSGSVSFKICKVSSMMGKLLTDAWKTGKSPEITVIGKLGDPSALGSERVALYHCRFDEATLMDWESGKVGEDTYSGSFTDYEYLDAVG